MGTDEVQPMKSHSIGQDWNTVTLAQAAGVTDAYIRYLLLNGTLQGEKFSRVWRISYEVGRQWLEGRQK